LEVEASPLTGRWQCRTRNLTLTHNLFARITLETAEYASGKHGEPVTSWHTQRANIPARIQPVSRETRFEFGALRNEITHVIYLATWELDSSQAQVRDVGGRRFTVEQVVRAERLGELTELRVRQIR
jgi:SPP1 family predicted phage head-tail adaptor